MKSDNSSLNLFPGFLIEAPNCHRSSTKEPSCLIPPTTNQNGCIAEIALSFASQIGGRACSSGLTARNVCGNFNLCAVLPSFPSYLIRFLLRIRGALTAAPTRLDPVSQIPHAAPTMLSPSPNATPKFAYPYGLMWVSTSAHPALQYSELHVADDDDIAAAAVGVASDCFRLLSKGSSYLSLTRSRAVQADPVSHKRVSGWENRTQTTAARAPPTNNRSKKAGFLVPAALSNFQRRIVKRTIFFLRPRRSESRQSERVHPHGPSVDRSPTNFSVSGEQPTPEPRLSFVAIFTVARCVHLSNRTQTALLPTRTTRVDNDRLLLLGAAGRTTQHRCTFEGLVWLVPFLRPPLLRDCDRPIVLPPVPAIFFVHRSSSSLV
jgi:hypothetical protein